ncbi:uncharacterized protein LOC121070722 isoform X2 [Cygnus olor]|uniref:uncharacterized protein LOC121070722 isoform X2 n=1 Tax=Cygnus olor TaxID=8869 RepID=UPI001ADE9AE4|nr:uncharacterized protein LOC121070722 isoform X2 [Cygnus olor]
MEGTEISPHCSLERGTKGRQHDTITEQEVGWMWMLSETREDKGRKTSLHKHIFKGGFARTQEHIHVQVEQLGHLNHSPMFFWWTMGFCQGLQRMKRAFPSPSIIQAKDGEVLPGRSASLHVCQHFALPHSYCGGKGVFLFPAGNKSLRGKFRWYSSLHLHIINEAIRVLLRDVSASAGEPQMPLPRSPRGHQASHGVQRRRAVFRAHAAARRGSPIVQGSQVSVCWPATVPSRPTAGEMCPPLAAGMKLPPQSLLKLVLRTRSGHTAPFPE